MVYSLQEVSEACGTREQHRKACVVVNSEREKRSVQTMKQAKLRVPIGGDHQL